MTSRSRRCPTFLRLVLVALAFALPLTGAEPGSVTGTVSNAATRNLLPGARVEIAPLGLSALTDDTGRYVLAGVPAGSTSSSSPTSVWTPSGAP